jgi:hypothetical protein
MRSSKFANNTDNDDLTNTRKEGRTMHAGVNLFFFYSDPHRPRRKQFVSWEESNPAARQHPKSHVSAALIISGVVVT